MRTLLAKNYRSNHKTKSIWWILTIYSNAYKRINKPLIPYTFLIKWAIQAQNFRPFIWTMTFQNSSNLRQTLFNLLVGRKGSWKIIRLSLHWQRNTSYKSLSKTKKIQIFSGKSTQDSSYSEYKSDDLIKQLES